MLAMILRSVLFPLPFRPTIPKNSPAWTVTLTSSKAIWRSKVRELNGWRKCSFKVVRCWCGRTNAFETFRTSITCTAGSDSLGEPRRFASEEVEADRQRQERNEDRKEPPSVAVEYVLGADRR